MVDYSATPGDFVRIYTLNWLRGKPDSGPKPDEREYLYPGMAAVLLAAAAFLPRDATRLAVPWDLTALSVDAALGRHGLLFPWLQQVVPLLSSLRSSARFGVFVLLSLSLLAGLGAANIFRARPRYVTAIGVMATLLCLLEYSLPRR